MNSISNKLCFSFLYFFVFGFISLVTHTLAPTTQPSPMVMRR
ncbi:Uncharacterised protein [Segatella copri]|nr:Uncharacterised protein [Segatella copri]